MGDFKTYLRSKTHIDNAPGYSYTFEKFEDKNGNGTLDKGEKVVGSIMINDYENRIDNHAGVVNNNFGEVTKDDVSLFVKSTTQGCYKETIEKQNSITNKEYADIQGKKTDKGFEITTDNKIESNFGSLVNNVGYKESYSTNPYLYNSPASSFNPLTMPGASGVSLPFFPGAGADVGIPTLNADPMAYSKFINSYTNIFSSLAMAGTNGEYNTAQYTMPSLVGKMFSDALNIFKVGSMNTPTVQNNNSVNNSTVNTDDTTKKLEALKEEAKKLGISVDDKNDNLETLQPKVDAKKLENLKTEATKLGITYDKDIKLDALQKLVDDKKAELEKAKPPTENNDDKPFEYNADGKKIKVYKNDKGNQVHEEYDANGKKVYSCEYTKDGYIINNYDKDGNAKTLNITKDGKPATTNKTTTPENTTAATNKTTKNDAGQTLVETTDSQGNKVIVTMDKNMNIILKTTSYNDGSYKKEMPGDPTFNKPGNISLTVHKDGKAELTCTARRADNLYTPTITHRYENYKDNNTTDLESWTKQGELISTTVNPNCKSYKPYTYNNKKYELAQETKKAQEEAKKSQDKLKKLQEEAKKYN